jgi:hypothetical protein
MITRAIAAIGTLLICIILKRCVFAIATEMRQQRTKDLTK